MLYYIMLLHQEKEVKKSRRTATWNAGDKVSNNYSLKLENSEEQLSLSYIYEPTSK
jgi:hypothetical protein